MAKESVKIKSPIELVVAICDKGLGEELEDYLESQDMRAGIIMSGKGTAESMFADLFGFGLDEKDILGVIVPIEKTEKIVGGINAITGIEDDRYGLTMVLPLSSADSNIIDLAKVLL